MEWIELSKQNPDSDEDILMFLNGNIWKGKIWQACPNLDPINSLMPTHWYPIKKQKLDGNEKDKIADLVYAEVIKGIKASLSTMEYDLVVSWDGHIIVDGIHFYKGYIKFET